MASSNEHDSQDYNSNKYKARFLQQIQQTSNESSFDEVADWVSCLLRKLLLRV
jgi:hypothetical protein